MSDGTFNSKHVPDDTDLTNDSPLVLQRVGITEQHGYFLIFGTNHGEELSQARWGMLKSFAEKPRFTVLVIDCEQVPLNEKGAIPFLPLAFRVMDAKGKPSDGFITNINDFRARYVAWLRQPSDGGLPFTLSFDEWKLKYGTGVSQHDLDAVQYVARHAGKESAL